MAAGPLWVHVCTYHSVKVNIFVEAERILQ
jgi:hypothetical protein